ncbi:nitroreductase family protein, partial [Rubrivivax gelatinosus]|uniref:nitroreductase family protein n=1 Tax=Rubrivivax gelatinosus TaxID=28068 RepID=UPI001ED8ED53
MAYGALLAGGATLAGCDESAVQQATARLQRRLVLPGSVDGRERLRALVQAATLAPSSHNTQCWRFVLGREQIRIEPDTTRRCPAVDPENLVQAALAHGLMAEPQVGADGRISVALAPTRPRLSARYTAIVQRQTTRGVFDGRPLPAATWRQLEDAAEAEGVTARLITDTAGLERLLAAVVAGLRTQLSNRAFVWLRFDAEEAARSGDGLFIGCNGQPSMPPWLARRLVRRFLHADSEARRSAEQLRSSAGVVILASDAAGGPARWVEVGRAFQRL